MLLLKKHGDGWRSRWYGRWKEGGRIREVPLCKWKGTPPASGRIGKDEGDRVFEASRVRALEELRQISESKTTEADRAAQAERVYRARYEQRSQRRRKRTLAPVKISGLYEVWLDRPRTKTPTAGRDAVVRRTFDRFADYMKRTAPRVTETGALRKEHVDGFLEEIAAEGVSPRTYNGALSLLRGTLERADPFSEAIPRLKDTPKKPEYTIHRTPFSAEELERVYEAAERDPLIHDLIVTAACTAMRRGDVCRLRFKDVDLKAGFVTVKTSKTGETVEIPIFPRLRAVLEAIPRRGPFVFPEAEKIYRQAPDALDRKLQAVLEDAGFVRPPRKAEVGKYPAASSDEVMEAAEAGMLARNWSGKRQAKGKEILARHLRGETGRQIAEALGTTPGGVSTYLHDLEELTRIAIVTTPLSDEPPPEPSALTVGEIAPDNPRKRRPSLKGWHSFRTTWITLAVAAGVPVELVAKVSGHRTGETLLKYYNRAGREQFQRVLGDNLPRALVGDGGAAKPSLKERLKKMDATNWKKIKAELLKEVAT